MNAYNVVPIASLQADSRRRIQRSRRAGRSWVQALNDETKRHAHNHLTPWSDDDVETLINLIGKDATTFAMAMELGRSYYAAQNARSHVSFVMRHAAAFKKSL